MNEIHVITRDPIPKRLHGIDKRHALRPTALPEIVSIEDCFFRQGEERKVRREACTIVMPDTATIPPNLEEYATLAEFALSLLASSGHPTFHIVASFSDGTCVRALHLGRNPTKKAGPKFAAAVNGSAATQWLRRCVSAQMNLSDRLHVTAERYVRYARSDHLADALMDLCICLESLLDSQTEISFRFGVCLAKVTGEKGNKAEDVAQLLSDLYEVRSKLAHGDPAAAKLLRRIEPQLPALRSLARRILTTYILFASEHSRDEWKSHLRRSLFI